MLSRYLLLTVIPLWVGCQSKPCNSICEYENMRAQFAPRGGFAPYQPISKEQAIDDKCIEDGVGKKVIGEAFKAYRIQCHKDHGLPQ